MLCRQCTVLGMVQQVGRLLKKGNPFQRGWGGSTTHVLLFCMFRRLEFLFLFTFSPTKCVFTCKIDFIWISQSFDWDWDSLLWMSSTSPTHMSLFLLKGGGVGLEKMMTGFLILEMLNLLNGPLEYTGLHRVVHSWRFCSVAHFWGSVSLQGLYCQDLLLSMTKW